MEGIQAVPQNITTDTLSKTNRYIFPYFNRFRLLLAQKRMNCFKYLQTRSSDDEGEKAEDDEDEEAEVCVMDEAESEDERESIQRATSEVI